MTSIPENKRTNLFVFASTAFLRGAHNSVFNVIWQPFVLSLGASMSTLGLLNSLGGMNGILTTMAQPLGGWLADRVGRKPFLIASSVFLILGCAIFVLAGWLNLWTVLFLGLILFGLSSLAIPARNSMTAESSHFFARCPSRSFRSSRRRVRRFRSCAVSICARFNRR